ncbi:hypothetical protein TgHK011_008418 [Trichoderma gracile]|nr:hypothetical protein TgHK011_008418 [Trichoderma gracile]
MLAVSALVDSLHHPSSSSLPVLWQHSRTVRRFSCPARLFSSQQCLVTVSGVELVVNILDSGHYFVSRLLVRQRPA